MGGPPDQCQGAQLRVVAHGVVLADVQGEIGHPLSVALVKGERAGAEVLAHQRLDAFDGGGDVAADAQGFLHAPRSESSPASILAAVPAR